LFFCFVFIASTFPSRFSPLYYHPLSLSLWGARVVQNRVAAMDEPDEELEYTLLNKKEVYVYQIPPASTAQGHKADDWKKCIWRGRCQVMGQGQNMNIKMIDSGSGKLFANCMIPNGDHEKFVERTCDSSRYFVLKISNGDRHAFIGMGFDDRNDAFDFNVVLQDFRGQFVDKAPCDDPENKEQSKDFSLKEGQKITLKIGGSGSRRRPDAAQANGGGLVALAPPPPAGQSRRQANTATTSVQPQASTGIAPDMDFSAFAAAPAAAPVPASSTKAASPLDDPFGDFDDFQVAARPPAAVAAPMPAAASPQPDILSDPFGQMSLGSGSSPAPAAAPTSNFMADPFAPQAMAAQPISSSAAAIASPWGPVTTQPAAVAPSTFSLDPFSNIAPVVGSAAPPSRGVQSTGGAAKRDPFDDFDMFK